MDFAFSEEQLMIRDLARGILEKELTPERIRETERGAEWFDRALWATLAEAGLLGLAAPEDLGGMGFGFLEVCVLLEEIGRAVAPVPVLPTLVLGALPVARFGSEEQKRAWLPRVASGKTVLTAALVDAGASDPSQPATVARADGGGWRLEGRKLVVPAAGLAERVLVPASTTDGFALFLVDPRGNGVARTTGATSAGDDVSTLELSGARVEADDRLGQDRRSGAEPIAWLHDCAVVATCATQLGVSERALEMTSRYVSERMQFGVPIGSFQAVQHRTADGYIDLDAMRWVTWRAAWRLAGGEPAPREAAVAKFWAAEGGSRIASAAQHLHGGIGADVDYPIHRYFLWSKTLELSLGGAMPHLATLGRDLATNGLQRT